MTKYVSEIFFEIPRHCDKSAKDLGLLLFAESDVFIHFLRWLFVILILCRISDFLYMPIHLEWL